MQYCPQCRSDLEPKTIDEFQRLACSADCGYVFWNNPTPVVAVIVETPQGVVLAHNKAWPAGRFSVITGFLERGEHPHDCAVRETAEELGLKAQKVNFVGFEVFDGQGISGAVFNQLIIGFHIYAEGSIVLDQQELDDYKLIPLEKLQGWQSATGRLVEQWLQQRADQRS
ncbi:phosphatase [Bacterioplanes sanyensis]|uniref:NUDIX domain-containing protein n=1 Tax=Bacterioplanes sanyensis TaxID=1249553 RepID=UPI00167225EA|nr:NUDIX domain-containing protein [Bacterioplanes sanyensis]GGY52124.1 phosphatase [Bacterioplanes sanyensis]